MILILTIKKKIERKLLAACYLKIKKKKKLVIVSKLVSPQSPSS